MRNAIILAGALTLVGSYAIADEVIVHPTPGVVIEHRSSDVTKEKTVTHHSDGCATKTVKKSDDNGNSVTRTKSNC